MGKRSSIERDWRVIHTGIGESLFTGWIEVTDGGTLWCESYQGGVTVFGPGMWVRAESQENEREGV